MTTQKFQIKALTALYQNSSDVRLWTVSWVSHQSADLTL
jgi:hypothetical protein